MTGTRYMTDYFEKSLRGRVRVESYLITFKCDASKIKSIKTIGGKT